MNKAFKCFLLVLPVGVISFCCWFFWTAFDRTMSRNSTTAPALQILTVANSYSNVVWKIVKQDEALREIEKALSDRTKIVREEHDCFRAELATWLSVFGLLSILATLIVPICGHLLQIKEVERLQTLLLEQEAKTEEIKKELAKIVDSRQAVDNSTAAISEFAEASHNLKTSETDLRGFLFKFKTIWGRDRVDEKIEAGLKLFTECDERITKAIGKKDYDEIVRCVDTLNSACAYLGGKSLQEFKPSFCRKLRQMKPLKNDVEDVNRILKENHEGPRLGYYKAAMQLQEGVEV